MVRPDDGSVEERSDFIRFDGQLLEEALPDSPLRPTREPVEYRLPATESFGQVAPRNPGPGPKDDRVDEVAVAPRGTRAGSTREERLDALPLSVGELVSVHGQC